MGSRAVLWKGDESLRAYRYQAAKVLQYAILINTMNTQVGQVT